jgi:tRNA uridine 5-carbamoylmethylation protein Kti12
MSRGLVIVGGAPATGKTTLAHELGRSLELPVITKDDVKESLAALAPTVVIVCRTPVARQRYAERATRGRHRVHIDGAVLDEWPGDDSAHQIDIGTPRLVVDTTDGYVPDLGRIVAFARNAGGLAP